MNTSLWNQELELASYLPEFKSLPLSYDNPLCFPTKTFREKVPVTACSDLRHFNLDFLFHYDVFPKNVLTFFGEWQLESRELRIDDVIVQQAYVPPFRAGLKFIFGVRVLSAYRTEHKAGFGYGTLCGHPEKGTNEFYFSIEDGELFASVRTMAEPGLPVSRLLASVFTTPYVDFWNCKALARMVALFEKHNAALCSNRRLLRTGSAEGK